MESVPSYENFPVPKVLFSVLLSVLIYALGAAILSGFGYGAVVLYLLFCIGAEIRVMKSSCVDCYYFAKWCAFGKGKVAPLFFRQGDPARFAAKCISWKDLLPDMLLVLLPMIGGIALLIREPSWGVAMMLAALAALATSGNKAVRTRISCKYCRQRELGCPAERFFGHKSA